MSPFVAFQFTFIVENVEVKHVVVPLIIAIIFGILWAKLDTLANTLKKQQKLFKAIVDDATEFTYLKDLDNKYIYLSPMAEKITGYKLSEFYKDKDLLDSIIYKDDLQKWLNHIHKVNDKQEIESLEFRIVTKDGKVKWIQHICSQIYDHNAIASGLRSTNIDITLRKEDEAKLNYLAYYDPLTSLGNKRLLEEDVDLLIENEKEFVLLLLDLDNFKYINDNYGHHIGDDLLKQIAIKLKKITNDKSSIAYRFGGDEFLIIYSNFNTKLNIESLCIDIVEEFNKPITIEDSIIPMTMSIGVCDSQTGKNDYTTILKNADIAMYNVKKHGKNNYIFYSDKLKRSYLQDLEFTTMLTQSIKSGGSEFYMQYQAQYDINKNIVGFESLARWNSIVGNITPDRFISEAENCNLIVSLEIILKQITLKDAKLLIDKFGDIKVAMNFNVEVLASNEFMDFFYKEVALNNIEPRNIEIELTESLSLSNHTVALKNLNILNDKGYQIALDDFGTGYSSLSYFKSMPIHTLKIDQSFIQNMIKQPLDRIIVDIIIDFTKKLNYKVIAEGVEKVEQLEVLKGLGCDYYQGYYLAKPINIEKILDKDIDI